MDVDLSIEAEQKMAELLTCSLPFAKVKKICKLDPEVHTVTPDAVKMISKATEIFIGEMAKACYTQAVIDKRKTVQKKDIDHVIKNNWLFEQLEDLIDDWPELVVRSRVGKDHNTDSALSAHPEDDGEMEALDESAVDLPETAPPEEDLPETAPPTSEENMEE